MKIWKTLSETERAALIGGIFLVGAAIFTAFIPGLFQGNQSSRELPVLHIKGSEDIGPNSSELPSLLRFVLIYPRSEMFAEKKFTAIFSCTLYNSGSTPIEITRAAFVPSRVESHDEIGFTWGYPMDSRSDYLESRKTSTLKVDSQKTDIWVPLISLPKEGESIPVDLKCLIDAEHNYEFDMMFDSIPSEFRRMEGRLKVWSSDGITFSEPFTIEAGISVKHPLVEPEPAPAPAETEPAPAPAN